MPQGSVLMSLLLNIFINDSLLFTENEDLCNFCGWFEIIIGVPQGSVLMSLLLNIFINDSLLFTENEDLCNFCGWFEIIIGVPQGSVLMSLLLNIFINDHYSLQKMKISAIFQMTIRYTKVV